MSSPFRILEILVCSLTGFLPFILLMIYPFRNHLRFGNVPTACFTALAALIQMSCDLAAGTGYLENQGLVLLLDLAIQILLCLLLVRAPISKTLFAALTSADLAVLIAATGKFLETLFFPAQATEVSRWTYLLLAVVLQLLILTPYALVLAVRFSPTLNHTAESLWKPLCPIPAVVIIAACSMMFFGAPPWLTAAAILLLNVCACLFALQQLRKAGAEIITAEVKRAPRPRKERKTKVSRKAPEAPAAKKEVRESIAPRPKIEKSAAQPPKAEPLPAQLEILQYGSLQERIAESERFHQELRRHVDTMAYHLSNQEYDKLRTHFTTLQEQFPKNAPVIYCENPAANPVLAYFVQLAGYCGAKILCDMQLPQLTPEINSDLALLIGNLLDNAIDACKAQKSSDRRIWISGRVKQRTLFLTVENTYDLPIRKDEQGRYLSAKHPGCGIGLQVCRQIADRYNGSLLISESNYIFKVDLILNL